VEFRLNKIDPDVRQKINEATKEGKIHSKGSFLQVSKDANQKNGNGKESFKEKFQKYDKKSKIVIKAMKVQHIEVNGYIDDEEEKVTTRGMFLDIRK
jgi:hypothetical protein